MERRHGPGSTGRRLAVATLAALAALPAGTTIEAAQAAPRTTAAERSAAASNALRKVHAPYRWGATGPSAFDCSGLVGWAYERAGHDLGVRTSQQMLRLGARIRRVALRRGDLVYTWDRGYGHVGIYVGGNRYVHAPGAGRRVRVSSVPGRGGFVAAVRP